jgi:hypothetical protein
LLFTFLAKQAERALDCASGDAEISEAIMYGYSLAVTACVNLEGFFARISDQRRLSTLSTEFCDMIGFRDLYGLINGRIVSLGQYGKTSEIMSSLPEGVVKGLVMR